MPGGPCRAYDPAVLLCGCLFDAAWAAGGSAHATAVAVALGDQPVPGEELPA